MSRSPSRPPPAARRAPVARVATHSRGLHSRFGHWTIIAGLFNITFGVFYQTHARALSSLGWLYGPYWVSSAGGLTGVVLNPLPSTARASSPLYAAAPRDAPCSSAAFFWFFFSASFFRPKMFVVLLLFCYADPLLTPPPSVAALCSSGARRGGRRSCLSICRGASNVSPRRP
jgi:hypothetical protein